MSIATDLIDHLKKIADDAISAAEDRAASLSFAGALPGTFKGTNKAGFAVFEVSGLAKAPLDKPADIALAGWTMPAVPSLPVFPAIPEELKISQTKIDTAIDAAITKISNTWVSAYFPAKNDSAFKTTLDDLTKNLFGGQNYITATDKLKKLEDDTIAALKAATDLVETDLKASIKTLGDNLLGPSGNAGLFGDARTNVATALAIPNNGTQNVAWVNARNQVAREAARKEREAVAKFAARGFALPAGVLLKIAAQGRQDTLDASIQIAAEQAIKTQQLFFDTAKMSVETYMRLMDLQAQTEMTKFREATAMQMRRVETVLDANKFNAKLAFDNLGLTLDFTKFAATTAVSLRLGIINGINGLMSAYAAVGRNETDYLNAIAEAQSKARQAMTEYYRVAIQSADVGLKRELANQENNMKYIETAANYLTNGVGNLVKSASASADVYSRVAGMALSGLNGVASVTEQLSS